MKFNFNKNLDKRLVLVCLGISIIGGVTGCSNNKEDDSSISASDSNQDDKQIQVEIPEDVISDLSVDLMAQIDNFNYKVDQFYSEMWLEHKFLSKDSYLVKADLERVIVEEVLDYFGESFTEFEELELSEELLDMAIHFAIPKDLVPYLGEKISDEDLNILTVYTAVFTDEGVYISSKYDEGGVITEEEYRDLISAHSWNNGDINYLTTIDDSKNQDYEDIIKVIVGQNPDLEGLDVKYLACDEKDAIIVVGSPTYSTDIRQYALSKNEESGEWEILIDQLENLETNVYINYRETTFNLDLLPSYDLKSAEITSHTILVDQLIAMGNLPDDTITVYACTTGSFGYYIFENEDILLTYTNSDGVVDLFIVDKYEYALEYMLELEENAPTYIIKYN